MQLAAVAALLLALAAPACSTSTSATPMEKVVSLLTDLKGRLEQDGKDEQKSYDKFACWCEEALGKKASDISSAKEKIEELQNLIFSLKGGLGTHGAEIKQLEKEIAANIESQRVASEVRKKENAEYQGERTESEQCIGALEAAINILTGAGAKKGFLETLQEARLLSAVAGVRGLLRQPVVTHTVSGTDLQVVQRFVDRPEDFVGARSEGLSAAQIEHNPFGDYAPQSTQIQGILKGMYDAFAADLEKANVEEASKQKGFEELMATKEEELVTLKATLEQQTGDNADKTLSLADSRSDMDATKVQLAADEKFFVETKASCKSKSGEWAERSRLRTEELQGISKALEILDSDEAKKTFKAATTTLAARATKQSIRAPALVQVSAAVQGHGDRSDAYGRLRMLAAQYHSVSLAAIAAEVKTGGHFDKVFVMIDEMIALLRKEDQEDIAHRDRCQGGEAKNKIDREDLAHEIEKETEALEHMADTEKKLEKEIATLTESIKTTEDEMVKRLEMRNTERAEFQQAVKDDADAVALLQEAILTISEFYRNNKLPIELVQKPESHPPKTSYSGEYGGRAKESTGIVAILSMLKEDLEKETKVAREEDADAQIKYEEDRSAMQKSIDADKAARTSTEKDVAELQEKIADKEEFKAQKEKDLSAAEEIQKSLEHDCAWVETHFESRREKRAAEIDGLVEAKNILAGAGSTKDGDDLDDLSA